jgi:hypothetical protein
MLRPPRFAVCLCIETNHQAALLWHRVAHFEVRHHIVTLFLMIRYGVQSLPSSTVVRRLENWSHTDALQALASLYCMTSS